MIIGLVNGRTVNPSHLASQCYSSAQIGSSYRRLQRFFQYVTLEGDWLAAAVVTLLKLKGPYVLCLDRTNWRIGRRDVNILMLVLATRRFRIPLMWTVLDKPGASNQAERIAWLLADREFIGGRWMGFLLQNKILFAIRVKENGLVHFQDGRREQIKALLAKPHGCKRPRRQPARLAALDESLGFPLFFAAKRLADGEFLTVSSSAPAQKAVQVYRRRRRIECLFGDGKTRGFNMEDTRLTQPAKLSALLVIITLAMAWAHATATAVKGAEPIKIRGHGYRGKSWFRLGFDQLRKWILHQPDRAARVWRRIWPKPKSIRQSERVV